MHCVAKFLVRLYRVPIQRFGWVARHTIGGRMVTAAIN